MSTPQALPIACDLGALLPAERERRAELAQRLVSKASRIEELSDGYALVLGPSPELAREGLEWLLLESRCCPFLELELALPRAGGWFELRLRGAPEAKAFLATTPLSGAGRRASCC